MCRSMDAIFHYWLVCFSSVVPTEASPLLLSLSVSSRVKKRYKFPWSLVDWSDLGGYSDSGFLSRWLVSFFSRVTLSVAMSRHKISSSSSSPRVLRLIRRLPLRAACARAVKKTMQLMLPSKHVAGQWVHASSSMRGLGGDLRFKELFLIRKVSDWASWPGSVEAAAWEQLIWATSRDD